MKHPLWFTNFQNFEPDNETNLKLVRRIEKKGVFGFIGIQESNPIVLDYVQPNIIAFSKTWLVEAGLSAVVDIFIKRDQN
ncbi:hypothetical protein A3Q56_08389 [Intoshia linei]|uniref:Uncharacterized protein n=1 Tax=Intoshia linei TaxID=1819745 RepID=A0A177APF1_9BILA|nr:hypothetical protein A3Q56_08389 [Intoshia linei]